VLNMHPYGCIRMVSMCSLLNLHVCVVYFWMRWLRQSPVPAGIDGGKPFDLEKDLIPMHLDAGFGPGQFKTVHR
jgi:hypothetical protein